MKNFLQSYKEFIEEIIDFIDNNEDFIEIISENNVELEILVNNIDTFLFTKNEALEEILMLSPISGIHKFQLDNNLWISKNNPEVNLMTLIKKEIESKI